MSSQSLTRLTTATTMTGGGEMIEPQYVQDANRIWEAQLAGWDCDQTPLDLEILCWRCADGDAVVSAVSKIILAKDAERATVFLSRAKENA